MRCAAIYNVSTKLFCLVVPLGKETSEQCKFKISASSFPIHNQVRLVRAAGSYSPSSHQSVLRSLVIDCSCPGEVPLPLLVRLAEKLANICWKLCSLIAAAAANPAAKWDDAVAWNIDVTIFGKLAVVPDVVVVVGGGDSTDSAALAGVAAEFPGNEGCNDGKVVESEEGKASCCAAVGSNAG